jgi:hypothetical protein
VVDFPSMHAGHGRIIPKQPTTAIDGIEFGALTAPTRAETSRKAGFRLASLRWIDGLLDSETVFTVGVVVIGLTPAVLIAIVVFSH